MGVGGFRGALRTTGTSFDIFRGGQSAFQWQAIAGLAVSIAPDVDLFGEYRYRENEADANSGFVLYPPHPHPYLHGPRRMWRCSACAGS